MNVKETSQNNEDFHKIALKNGLGQLNILQLQRVINYPGEMVLDNLNYENGNFCPLGIALGLDKIITEPTHDKVFQMLTNLGYKVNNTKNVEGSFYTDNRKEDLLQAAQEVLNEKESINDG